MFLHIFPSHILIHGMNQDSEKDSCWCWASWSVRITSNTSFLPWWGHKYCWQEHISVDLTSSKYHPHIFPWRGHKYFWPPVLRGRVFFKLCKAFPSTGSVLFAKNKLKGVVELSIKNKWTRGCFKAQKIALRVHFVHFSPITSRAAPSMNSDLLISSFEYGHEKRTTCHDLRKNYTLS